MKEFGIFKKENVVDKVNFEVSYDNKIIDIVNKFKKLKNKRVCLGFSFNTN
jgi:hypothetical protein